MALTEAEKLTIARILRVTPTYLGAQITSLGATLTAEVETAIRAELSRWETAGIDFVKVHPKEKNFGAEINPALEQQDIRVNLAVLFEMPVAVYTVGMGTLQIG